MPLPDDPEKNQEVLLPPLPPLPKREIVIPENKTNQNVVKTNDSEPIQSIPKDVPQITASENRRSNRIKFNLIEEPEIKDNQEYENKKNQDNTLTSENENLSYSEEQYSDEQEKNLVFSKAELEEIENVMAKPKTTINKRQTIKKQNTSLRTVPFSTRKNSKTNVIKDDFSNESAEDQ